MTLRISVAYFLNLISFMLLSVMPLNAEAKPLRKHRQIPSWYLGLTGSVNFVEDSSITEQGGPLPQNGTLSFDQGYGFAGAIGYRPRYTNSVLDNLRFEFEMGLIDADIDQFSIINQGIVADIGDVQAVRMMSNAFIDFNATNQLRPYIGGGLGVARIEVESDDDTVFAYQGMAGMYYTPTSFPAAEIGLGYRYFGTTNPNFTTPGTGSQVEMEFDAHSLEAGVRFYF